MTLWQNGLLRYGHFSDVLEVFVDKMVNLGPIQFKIGFYIKVYVNKRQYKFKVHISKYLAINRHKIGQMPLCCLNIKLT